MIDMAMQGAMMSIVTMLIIALIPIIILIMLIMAVFEMNKNIREIRVLIERNNNPYGSELSEEEKHRREESWIYE